MGSGSKDRAGLVAEMPMVRSLWDARCHFCGGPSFPWMTDDATWAQVEPMLGQHQACFECFMLARHMLEIDISTPMRVGVCRANESRNPHSKNLHNVGQFQGGQIPEVLEAAALELDRLMDEEDVLRAAVDRCKERMTHLERERDEARAALLVPATWYCPVCDFVCVKSILHTDGGISDDNRKTGECCPNCPTVPLLRETWQKRAHDAEAAFDRQGKRMAPILQALQGLSERDEDGTCRKCGDIYSVPPGLDDSTGLCNECAQEIAEACLSANSAPLREAGSEGSA